MVIPCDLPEGLELLTASPDAEVYRYTDAGGDIGRAWIMTSGNMLFTSHTIVAYPADVVQWLVNRSHERRGGTDA